MIKPLLSICIPTYCRSNYLKDCLAAITLQFDENPILLDKVQVVVSDNASNDDTTNVVSRYQDKYNNIKYVRNPINLGSDENYINSVVIADGLYGWLIGDDDFIINGAIDFVINFLEKNNVCVLTIESHPFENMSDVYKRHNDISNQMISFHQSHSDFFQKGYLIGVLCGTIFKRDLWTQTDRKNYNKGWSYYEIALKLTANSSLHKSHLAYPIIMVRDDCTWVENGSELFTFTNSNIIMEKMMSFGYNREKLKADLVKNSKRILIILLRAKGHGLKCNWDNLRYIFRNSKNAGYLYLFLATIIFFIPNSVIVAIRDLKKRIANQF